jgi:hypothetical protein
MSRTWCHNNLLLDWFFFLTDHTSAAPVKSGICNPDYITVCAFPEKMTLHWPFFDFRSFDNWQLTSVQVTKSTSTVHKSPKDQVSKSPSDQEPKWPRAQLPKNVSVQKGDQEPLSPRAQVTKWPNDQMTRAQLPKKNCGQKGENDTLFYCCCWWEHVINMNIAGPSADIKSLTSGLIGLLFRVNGILVFVPADDAKTSILSSAFIMHG